MLQFILPALSLLGGVLGNRKQTTDTAFNNTSTSQGSYANMGQSGSQVHTAYDPNDLNYFNSIRDKYTKLMNTDPDLSGYAAQGIADINRSAGAQNRNLEESLAARGIGGPQAAGLAANNDARRFSDITRFRQGIPLLSRQMQEDTLGKALTAFGMAPKDTYTDSWNYNQGQTNEYGTQQGTGTNTTPSNMAAGGIGSLAQMLAFLYGKGAFGGGAPGGSGLGPNEFDPWMKNRLLGPLDDDKLGNV